MPFGRWSPGSQVAEAEECEPAEELDPEERRGARLMRGRSTRRFGHWPITISVPA
jgi:hypothetical protein